MQNLRLSRPDLTTKRGKAIIVVATSAAVLVAILAVLLALGVVFSPQRAGYPYQAMKPGAPCDRTPGVWQDWASSRSDCLATGLLLRTSSSGGPYAQEAFYGPPGAKFPPTIDSPCGFATCAQAAAVARNMNSATIPLRCITARRSAQMARGTWACTTVRVNELVRVGGMDRTLERRPTSSPLLTTGVSRRF